MAEPVIREARAEDRAAVLAFCAQTWEWGDYIEAVWDKWLGDANGTLLVAVIDDQPVGLIHVLMLSATEAWLEGMRVDPAYRQRGLAHQLSMEAVTEALQRGATVVRVLTSSTNEVSLHIIGQGFFRQIGVIAPYSASPLTSIPSHNSSPDQPRLAVPSDLDDIIDYINVSNIFPATGGLYYSGFVGQRISDLLLSQKIQAGEIYLLRRWERLDGLAMVETRQMAEMQKDDDRSYLFIGYIDGTTESISLLAYSLRSEITRRNLVKVLAHIPDLIMVRDAFSGAEYDWDGNLYYAYERDLT